MEEVVYRPDYSERPLPAGYSRTFADMGAQGVYWHLFNGSDRINGGLQPYLAWAAGEASKAAWCHYWSTLKDETDFNARWDRDSLVQMMTYHRYWDDDR